MANNIIKKLVCVICVLAIIFSFAPMSVETTKAENPSITVFNVEDYIDEDLFDVFFEETGVEVNYVTFATNEDLYNELIKAPNSVDLICASDYMIMKMMTENLITPYDTPESVKEYNSPYIKSVFKDLKIEKDGQEIPIMSEDELTTYAVCYMWGTMGFVYNMDVFGEDELTTWNSILFNDKSKGKITIKDSIRDSYILALGGVYSEELAGLDKESETYNEELSAIFNRTGDEDIERVEQYLQELRLRIYGFEVDSGKEDILTGKINSNFAWSGDAVYAMDEGDSAEVNLGYFVPEEGSNVWFDGWVIPKNADKENAERFIEFLSRPETAIANMEYTGYTSSVAGDDVFDWLIDYYELETEEGEGLTAVDLSYFFDGVPEGERVVYTEETGRQLYAQYSDWDTIQRCAIMQNFDDDTLTRINNMWNRVKLVTLSNTAIILISVGLALMVVVAVCLKYRVAICGFFARLGKKK